jgi:hypothetical protein
MQKTNQKIIFEKFVTKIVPFFVNSITFCLENISMTNKGFAVQFNLFRISNALLKAKVMP